MGIFVALFVLASTASSFLIYSLFNICSLYHLPLPSLFIPYLLFLIYYLFSFPFSLLGAQNFGGVEYSTITRQTKKEMASLALYSLPPKMGSFFL